MPTIGSTGGTSKEWRKDQDMQGSRAVQAVSATEGRSQVSESFGRRRRVSLRQVQHWKCADKTRAAGRDVPYSEAMVRAAGCDAPCGA